MSSNRISTCLLIFIFYNTIIMHSVLSLQCFRCNSFTDSQCSSVTTSGLRAQVCPPHLQASCKTIIQDAPFASAGTNNSNKPTTRVYRDCSAIRTEDKHCMDRVGTEKVKLRYCICGEDACNHGALSNTAQIQSILFTTTITLLAYLYAS
uniref:Protein sleepless n=1 Tax=Trichobilharzia regenti TaxID=157069 RepID=A0AA85J7K0_TRIRE|nr:unnamed protein product [Trichobilharzia regenti]